MKIVTQIQTTTKGSALNDDYTRGRALFMEGQPLEACKTIAQRAGHIGMEADDRRGGPARGLFADAQGNYLYDGPQPWQIGALARFHAAPEVDPTAECPF